MSEDTSFIESDRESYGYGKHRAARESNAPTRSSARMREKQEKKYQSTESVTSISSLSSDDEPIPSESDDLQEQKRKEEELLQKARQGKNYDFFTF